MKISDYQKVEIELNEQELGRAVIQAVSDRLGGIDDAGCDWYTDDNRILIGGDNAWCVSGDKCLATLIDAGNILLYGHMMKANND